MKKKYKFRFNLGKMYLEPDKKCIEKMSPKTTWELRDTLGLFIATTLRQLAKTSHGYPHEYATYEEWEKALNEVADDFEFLTLDEFEMIEKADDKIKSYFSEEEQQYLEHKSKFDFKQWEVLGGKRKEVKERAFKRLSAIFEDLWD